MKTKAYSYIRFSTSAQQHGHSLVRQDDAAIQYAAAHGLELDDSLNMRDLGVSAFRGKNVSDGALGAFIKAIEDGRVAPGSLLLVEDIDRLSRLPVFEALDVFQRIIKGGITIVTLNNGAEYNMERLKGDWTPLMPVLFSMSRGHEESNRKSGLLSKAWKAKKEAARAGKPLGNNAPSWITYSKERGYELHPERQEIVRRIFQLSINGHGLISIAKILNAEGIPTFKTGVKWGNSSLQKVLQNRATIGEYQPREGSGKVRTPVGDPIQNYYPAVIDSETFYLAQRANSRRTITRSTQQTKNFSVWQGIAKCSLCNSPMHLVTKGKLPKGHTYLRCYSAKKGACEGGYVRLDESESIFKEILAKVDSLSLVQKSSAETAQKLAIVTQQIEERRGQLEQVKEFLKSQFSPSLLSEVARRDAELASLSAQKEELSRALASETIVDRGAFFDNNVAYYVDDAKAFDKSGYFDKDEFFARLDLVSYEGRNQANALLKELRITVRIQTGKPARYYVLQDGQPLLDLYRQGESVIFVPHTEHQRERLSYQGESASLFKDVMRKRTRSVM